MTLYLTDRHRPGGDRRAPRPAASCTASSSTRPAPPPTRMPASPTSAGSSGARAHGGAATWCCRCTAKSPTPRWTCSSARRASSTRCSRRWRSGYPRPAHRVRAHHHARRPWSSCAAARAGVAATITPQHLLMNRNALFAGGIRPHHYCLPVLKTERRPRGAARRRRQRRSALLPGHRQRAARARTPRRSPAAAPASSPRTPASSCTRRPSSPPARWRGCEGFASDSTARTSTACRATPARITLVEGTLGGAGELSRSARTSWCRCAPASASAGAWPARRAG